MAGGNFATPWRALSVLDGAVARYHLFALNAQRGMPDRDGVTLETPFVGPGMRGRGRLRYFPCRLSLVPALLATALPPDVVLVQTSAPSDGTVSLGTEVNVLPAAIEAARARGGLVIAQLNPRVPYTYGDAVLSCDAIDYAIEAEEPLPSPPERPPMETSALIGDRVAALIGDGATLQAGIGAVPDAVLAGLHRRRGTDRVVGDVQRRRAWPGQGGRARPGPAGHRVVRVRRRGPVRLDGPQPGRADAAHRDGQRPGAHRPVPADDLGQQRLEVDLLAQANATWVGGRVHSGFGGQTDFVVGALHSPGGQAIIALPSWHPKADVSTVVPMLHRPVTSFQHSYIVSEQGAAVIWGQDASSQAEQIIGQVAHPAAREHLREAAASLGLCAQRL